MPQPVVCGLQRSSDCDWHSQIPRRAVDGDGPAEQAARVGRSAAQEGREGTRALLLVLTLARAQSRPRTGRMPPAHADGLARCGAQVVVLTTHSMEEADALCSRIGILVNGSLRCVRACVRRRCRLSRRIGRCASARSVPPQPRSCCGGLFLGLSHCAAAARRDHASLRLLERRRAGGRCVGSSQALKDQYGLGCAHSPSAPSALH